VVDVMEPVPDVGNALIFR